jgi:peptidyl-prolyl cis-trans isomerase C
VSATVDVPRINGVALCAPAEALGAEELRQRACTELLRQAAIQAGLLPADDPPPLEGAISEQASAAVEALIEREVRVPESTEEACRRYYAAHAGRYSTGERVRARHVLFAVTPGVDVAALRHRAEACLLDLRCPTEKEDDRFPETAAALSNCSSGTQGGDLGWLTAGDVAPEFGRELFGQPEIGVLPRLVHSRFGLHVVEVLSREPGAIQPFETVQAAVAQSLRQQAFATALRHYLQQLATAAAMENMDFDTSATPLIQ